MSLGKQLAVVVNGSKFALVDNPELDCSEFEKRKVKGGKILIHYYTQLSSTSVKALSVCRLMAINCKGSSCLERLQRVLGNSGIDMEIDVLDPASFTTSNGHFASIIISDDEKEVRELLGRIKSKRKMVISEKIKSNGGGFELMRIDQIDPQTIVKWLYDELRFKF